MELKFWNVYKNTEFHWNGELFEDIEEIKNLTYVT